MPFLRDVWPQERSLATPGVSGALADLPAASGDAFAEAVDAIARFLVPFECWSMVEYGFYGEEGQAKKLAIIDDESKAKALLRLLDLTIGASEGAVIPYDLTDALEQIRSIAPSLADAPDLTDILNQRDREFISSELPVPAGLRTGSMPVVPAVGNAAMSAV